jgi:hypothetical protein
MIDETDRVESHRVERERERERERCGDLESFKIKSEMTRGWPIFIGSKISEAVLNQNRC